VTNSKPQNASLRRNPGRFRVLAGNAAAESDNVGVVVVGMRGE
jgi:hypothetical protein